MVFPIGPVRAGAKDTLIKILEGRRLAANLRLCLDAADGASYTSGQKWLDTSGNGHDFFFGTSASSQSADPTFNGTPGDKSALEYMSTDGGDYFQYDSANEAWMDNLHKVNARFSWGGVLYLPSGGGGGFIGTRGAYVSGSTTGITINLSSNRPGMSAVHNGTYHSFFAVKGQGQLSKSAWHFIAGSFNEPMGAGGGFLYSDGNYNQVGGSDTFNANYASSTTTNASTRMSLLSEGGASALARNGTRIAMLFFVEGAVLSKSDFDNIYADIKAVRPGFSLP